MNTLWPAEFDARKTSAKHGDQSAFATVSHVPSAPFDFALPPELEASAPPEARGLARDDVKLMVSRRQTDEIDHVTFHDIGRFLSAGDVLVINTAGTMNAALPAIRPNGDIVELHLSTRLPDGNWSVELRSFQGDATTIPLLTAHAGERLTVPAGGAVRLIEPYASSLATRVPMNSETIAVRLWRAEVTLPAPRDAYLLEYGTPIRYGYVREAWSSEFYQTVFATDRGSAEMPSAGRSFTADLITRLVAKGVQFAPVLLHTGVASLEDHEPPYAEYYHVPEDTARVVNSARSAGRRIIAVGTTAVRALETVSAQDGHIEAGEGWTEVFVGPSTGIRSVDGLLTGLHEPRATHLMMLEALVNRERLHIAYAQAVERRYLWHEFGDLHLIVP
jgi:S-adenosylmethionine:tRNA ribosyltransferase-isomerase